jgi:hypothetical protein
LVYFSAARVTWHIGGHAAYPGASHGAALLLLLLQDVPVEHAVVLEALSLEQVLKYALQIPAV